MIIKSELTIKCEFTAPGTPKQNCKVERAFVTLLCKTRSMLNAARITIPLRKGLWEKCANLSVQLENIIAIGKGQQSSAEMAYGTNPKWKSNMRTFGEMAIIARHSDKKIRSKLEDRGNTVMFVGYSDIQFMNIATKKTMFSRDVPWLNRTYS
jgi:hypothetical protein